MIESPAEAERFLIIRLGAIGDALRVLPAVRRLRRDRPAAFIGWAVEHWVHPVLKGNPNVNQFHVLNRKELEAGWGRALRETKRFISEIRSSNYQVVLDFHGRFKSGLFSRLSGAPFRIGYAKGASSEYNHLFQNIRVDLDDPLESRVLRFLHLLRPCGVDCAYDPNDHGLYVDAAAMEKANRWYEEAGRPPLAAYAGCSAKQAGHRRWPKEKWGELLRRLGDEEVRSVLFWGPDEKEFSMEIAEGAGPGCLLSPPTTLVDMMAMLSRCSAFVGSNTAAMNMAWLQGVPTAVFTGPSQPKTDAPLPPLRSRVLRAHEFAQEGLSQRLQADVTTAVTVEEALEAVRYLLNR